MKKLILWIIGMIILVFMMSEESSRIKLEEKTSRLEAEIEQLRKNITYTAKQTDLRLETYQPKGVVRIKNQVK